MPLQDATAKTGKLTVCGAPNQTFEMRDFPLRAPRENRVLMRTPKSTICRSDIHSYAGRRPIPCRHGLGHEIIGNILAPGDGITHDMRGDELAVDRYITWQSPTPLGGGRRLNSESLFSSCGRA